MTTYTVNGGLGIPGPSLPLVLSLSDLNPKVHLSNLSGKTTAKVAIIGDSTSTTGVNAVDPSMTIWGALQQALRRQNPAITFTFSNFGIGGANWNNMNQTGTASALTLPSWFTVAGSTWLSYVSTFAPDVLFVCCGINAPSAGAAAGSSVSTYIRTFMATVAAFVAAPNVILITNKVANPDAGSPYNTDHPYSILTDGFLRTFAHSNAKSYTTFSALTAKGFGLIDLGRHFIARTHGYDPGNQYLSQVTTGLGSGTIGATPVTLATSTHGDFVINLTFPAAGATALYNTLGATAAGALYVQVGQFIGNRVHLNLGNTGAWVPKYQVEGSDSNGVQNGTSSTPGSGDVTVQIVAKQSLLQVYVNGVLELDTVAPRFTGTQCPITCYTGTAPSGSMTVQCTSFYDGIGVPVTPDLSLSTAFGGSITGGNAINHPSGQINAAIDWATIQATNLCGQ